MAPYIFVPWFFYIEPSYVELYPLLVAASRADFEQVNMHTSWKCHLHTRYLFSQSLFPRSQDSQRLDELSPSPSHHVHLRPRKPRQEGDALLHHDPDRMAALRSHTPDLPPGRAPVGAPARQRPPRRAPVRFSDQDIPGIRHQRWPELHPNPGLRPTPIRRSGRPTHRPHHKELWHCIHGAFPDCAGAARAAAVQRVRHGLLGPVE